MKVLNILYMTFVLHATLPAAQNVHHTSIINNV